jgi:hypothetical protein
MITISPLSEITLRHSAVHVSIAESGHIAVLSLKGRGSLISPDLASVHSFSVPNPPRHFELSPDGSMLAVTAGNGITFYAMPAFKKLKWLGDSFECCFFGSTDLLWTCARYAEETVIIEAWEPRTWTRIAKAKVADPYGDSHIRLFAHPKKNCVVVWVAAGQDGQCLYWASIEGSSIEVSRFRGLDFTTPPGFSPNGSEFLVITEEELHRYSYPQGPLLSKMHAFNEERLGDFVWYANDEHALLAAGEGRVFIVNVVNMTVEDEIAILGHEPRPIRELYPRLKGDRGLGSDLGFFLPIPGKKFLSVHKELPNEGRDPEQRQYRLLVWRMPDIY